MKIAAIADTHGNLPALEAVLREIEQVEPDLVVVCGDLVSGPMPAATLDRLLQLGDKMRALRGNGDREVVTAFDGEPLDPKLPPVVSEVVDWTARQLERRHRDYLAALPEQLVFEVDGLGPVLFCHATPRNDVEIFTVASPDERVQEMMAGVTQNVVVCGHTHMQFDRRLGNLRLVNTGSVGMSYDGTGAYWALLGPDVELRHTAYDLQAAADQVRTSGYPQAEDFAAENILNPPAREEVVAIFERMAQGKA
jgi:putative phosphoesterase